MDEIYSDKVNYLENSIQVAYRDGSLEINRLYANVYGYRFNKDGCWFITSVQDGHEVDYNSIRAKALKHLLDRKCGGFSDAVLFRGNVEIGKEQVSEDEIAELIRNLCEETSTLHSTKCEAIVYIKTIDKEILRENNEAAHENRKVVEIEVGLLKVYDIATQTVVSNYMAVIPWSKDYITKAIDMLFRETINKLSVYSKARPLKPYQYGKATVVLGFEASAALIHEISHLLEAGYYYNTKLIGNLIASRDFNLYDNPHEHDSPTLRFFDDECVLTKKRVLIEDGVVRDLHHTRNTAVIYGSEPGSAYGLFQKPIPFHTTLTIRPGDWRENEIISETRNGFYIDGISMATLEKGYVRIVPENSFLVENGELSEAVRIREIKIPLINLRTISAISRSCRTRVSREREWIIAEKAPYIRLEAFIM